MRALIWRVNVATMLFFTLVQVVVPLIPEYLRTITTDTFIIGFTVSSISITAILLRPASGVASDKWSRSNLMIIGTILASVAYAILYFFGDVLHVMVARLIEGAAVASFIPSSIASAVDQAPKGKLGETLGWRSMMIGIGFTVGPALGGILAGALQFRTTFGISSLFLMLLIPLVVFRDTKRKSSASAHSVRCIGETGFVLALSGLIIYAVAWTGMLTFLSAYLESIAPTPSVAAFEIGLFLFTQAGFSVAFRVAAGRGADRHPAMMTYLGLLIISVALVVIYFTQVPPYLYFAAPIFGIGTGIYVPGSQTLALMRCPENSRGFLSSIYTMGLDIGNLIGPIMFGIIIQFTNSYQSVFALAPVLAFVAAMVVFIPTRIFHRQLQPFCGNRTSRLSGG